MAWAKIDDQFYMGKKTATIDRDEQDMYIAGLVYCNGQLTDGFIPAANLMLLYVWAKLPIEANAQASAQAIASRLVEHGLWEFADGAYVVHDFLDWNPSRADVEAVRNARTRAGRAGGERSATTKQAKRQANAKQTPSKIQAKVNPVPVPVPVPVPKEEEGGEAQPFSAAWTAFTKARGMNLTASDSEYVAELVTLYGDAEVAQAVVYCDKNKRDNFLRIKYIQTILTSWQAEGTLGLHTAEYESVPRNGRGKPLKSNAVLAMEMLQAEEDAANGITR